MTGKGVLHPRKAVCFSSHAWSKCEDRLKAGSEGGVTRSNAYRENTGSGGLPV